MGAPVGCESIGPVTRAAFAAVSRVCDERLKDRPVAMRPCERPLSWRGANYLKGRFGHRISLLFDLAGKKGVGRHATQPVISDNIAPRIDAERARRGRSRVVDGGVGFSGF